jgi:general secretion pathway protein J
MSVRYLSPGGEWQSSWPAEDIGIDSLDNPLAARKVELPKALEITLEHDHFGELVWLFRLPQ